MTGAIGDLIDRQDDDIAGGERTTSTGKRAMGGNDSNPERGAQARDERIDATRMDRLRNDSEALAVSFEIRRRGRRRELPVAGVRSEKDDRATRQSRLEGSRRVILDHHSIDRGGALAGRRAGKP